MEYLIGFLIAITAMIFVIRVIRNEEYVPDREVSVSQSDIHKLIYPYLFVADILSKEVPETQMTEFYKEVYVKVVIVNDKAYWISENKFMVANMLNGEVDKESQKQVDTISMSDVELKVMISIIEELTRGGTV